MKYACTKGEIMKNTVLVSLSNSPGMTNYSYLIANQLAQKNNVTVLAAKNVDHKLYSEQVQVIQANTVSPYITAANFRLFEMIRLIRAIHRLKPDFIHFLSPHPWNIPLATALYKKYRLIHTIHEPLPHAKHKHASLIVLFNKWFVRQFFEAVVVHGKLHVRTMNGWMNKTKIHVLPLPSIANPAPRPLRPNRNLLFFGMIEPYKGLHILLSALEILQNEGCEFHFTLAGKGDLQSYREQLEKIRNKTLHNRHIDEKDVNAFFENAHFVVLPYSYSSQSGIIPISYSNGRPVIVTNVGAFPEVVIPGKTGIIVEKDNPAMLADAIKTLLDNPALAQSMAEHALEYYHQNLHIEVVAKLLEEEVYL